jgi:protein-S-isoprenylcysteine O-methyltransferase Ste14
LTVIEKSIFSILLILSFILAAVIFTVLSFIDAPYGRHIRRDWGLMISNRLGWLVMESPAVVLFFALFLVGDAPKTITSVIFLLMWEAHYIHRALIYPFRIADGRKKMPVIITLMAFVFNTGNAYLNSRYLFSLSGGYPPDWLLDPRFIVGLALFAGGYAINRWSDRELRLLRAPGETGYKIPHGGLYEWVSCPNYLGEIIEWTGWALATWSLPGLAFALWTIANLAPRALSHHTWYREQFENYPPGRKALIPRVW